MNTSNAKLYVLAFMRAYRDEVRTDGIPLVNRRLATYRRAALRACSNRMSWQAKQKRLRKPASIDRARGAIECWREVEDYFRRAYPQHGGEFLMILCPICGTQYDPHTSECPTCGPIPTRPGFTPGVLVPDYSIPEVAERVNADADYIVDSDQRGKVK